MIRKINYKSDFKLFLSGNFTSPFRLTIYTSGNRQAGYTVSFDGQSYHSCSVDGWGRLVVAVDNHNMGLGNLVYDIESFLTDSDFADGVCDVYATALPVVDTEGNFYVLTAQGETDVDFDATIPPFYQIGPQGPQGEPGPQGPQGEMVPVVNDLTTGGADKALSAEMGKMLGAKLENKAPKVGYAPELKVNFAKELVGRGDATEQVIGGIRPTGVRSIGDGNATITKIKGESVVWNQLEPNHNLLANALSSACNNVTTVNGVVSIGGVTSFSAYIYVSRQNINIRKGHVYLLIVDARGAEKITNQMAVYDLDNKKPLISVLKYGEVTNQWATYAKIGVAQEDGVGSLFVYPAYSATLYNTLTDWQGRNFIIHDLTLMFGAGNEPKTIEEFEARKPLGVSNEYNEGTIVSFDGEAIKSVGFNAFTAENSEIGSISTTTGLNITSTLSKRSDFLPCVGNAVYEFITVNHMYEYDADRKFIRHFSLEGANFKPVTKRYTLTDKTRYIRIVYKQSDESSVCVHLAHTYTPERYPNGYAPYEADTHLLPDVKSILDTDGNKLFPHGLLSAGSVHDEITATKAVKRVGVVDMGTLNWEINEDFGGYDAIIEPWRATDNKRLLLTSKYSYKYQGYNKSDDKIICAIYFQYIFVRDSSFNTTAALKQALQGALLYYELAEPIEVDLPEPLNMTYEAWDFGTEELVADTPTTPLNAEIVYQFNAVDRIRENSSAIKDKADKTEVEKINDRTIELEKQINGEKNVTDSSSITSPSWTKKSLSKIIPKGSKIISIEGSFSGTGYLLGGVDSSESIEISIGTLPVEVPFDITMFTCSPISTTIVFNFTNESVKGIIDTLKDIDNQALRKTAQLLTEDEKEQTRKNIGAQKQLQLTVKDNGNIILSNLNGQSQEFMPATPSGDPMHYAYVSAGAEYNDTDEVIKKTAPWGTEETWVKNANGTYTYSEVPAIVDHLPHHYYLNGLGDITKEQMVEIYNYKDAIKYLPKREGYRNALVRTYFTPSEISGQKESQYTHSAFVNNLNLETLIWNTFDTNINTLNASYMYNSQGSHFMFNGCKKLKIVYPIKVKSAASIEGGNFNGCSSLVEVRLFNLMLNTGFKDSPNISKRSILYIVNNAVPTSAITITLHADAYARLVDDADIIAALTAKPLVTLVSA